MTKNKRMTFLLVQCLDLGEVEYLLFFVNLMFVVFICCKLNCVIEKFVVIFLQ